MAGWPWVEGRTDDPWDVEAQAEPLAFGEATQRPPNIVNLDEVELVDAAGEVHRVLAAAAGSKQTGLGWSRVEPNRMGPPPHCHSEEEEVFVILEGEGVLELWPTPVAEARGVQREDVPVRAGHVVARPPATRVGHAFRAGPDGMEMLVYGTRRPNDICYFPRSGKIYWRGVGLIGRVEPLGFSDGEPPD